MPGNSNCTQLKHADPIPSQLIHVCQPQTPDLRRVVQVGAPEVVAGIAQRALHVIHEAAQVAHAQSHSPTSRSASNSQGAGSMGGASSAIYSQGPSQGATQGHDSSNSEAAASTPAMPSMSGTSTATSYSDRSDHRSLSGRGESGRVGISSNPTSSQQGSGNMGGGSSAIYSQGPSKGDNGNDTKVSPFFWPNRNWLPIQTSTLSSLNTGIAPLAAISKPNASYSTFPDISGCTVT